MCWCRGCRRGLHSQRRIQDLIEVVAQRDYVDWWQAPPAGQERFGIQARWRERAEFGDLVAVSGDDDGFPSGDAIEDSTAVVSELANRDRSHGPK